MTTQKEKQKRDLYGAEAKDWVERWDSGTTIWSVEMGGLGPAYEQAIQITAVEIVRHMIDAAYDESMWDQKEFWEADREAINAHGHASPVIDKMGLSGAQWGAAFSLAVQIYRRGPADCLSDKAIEKRLIQVCSNFPAATPPA